MLGSLIQIMKSHKANCSVSSVLKDVQISRYCYIDLLYKVMGIICPRLSVLQNATFIQSIKRLTDVYQEICRTICGTLDLFSKVTVNKSVSIL